MARRKAPEVNAGSMADIAFLLLIFFLVTTTIETDSGLNRKLPPMEDVVDPPIIKERNIFTVVVNKFNQLLVEEKPIELTELRNEASLLCITHLLFPLLVISEVSFVESPWYLFLSKAQAKSKIFCCY